MVDEPSYVVKMRVGDEHMALEDASLWTPPCVEDHIELRQDDARLLQHIGCRYEGK